MSTLQETLRARRGIQPRAFVRKQVTETPIHTLAVVCWNKRSWHFPWSCLTRFEHDGSGTPEVLRLCFGEHEVAVEGKRLSLLLPEISGLRLESIREKPPGEEALVAEHEPFIQRITVQRPADRRAPATESS